ncbi:CBS domain-containing protein, partial [Vibrio alfacsensis]|uniref:CBS domain-containing protein n=1 Tax=Vibrio alfacsensis TaxID=1074311 RepID=UPI0040683442
VITIPFSISVDRAKLLIDKYNYEQPEHIYLIDKQKRFRGMVDYSDVLKSDPKTRIKQLVLEHVTTLSAKLTLAESVEAMERSSVSALPILDERKLLVGEIDWKFAL